MSEVLKKTYSGMLRCDLDSILLDMRMVFLEGEIESKSVNTVIKKLLFLESVDKKTPIKLVINSPGGSVSAGLLLYDQMKGMDIQIDIVCTEIAASMAAILLASGQPGHRFALKHSQVIIHEPLLDASSGLSGSTTNIVKSVESILTVKNVLIDLLARDTGHTVSEIEQVISEDVVMTSEEAVRFGVCDQVIERI